MPVTVLVEPDPDGHRFHAAGNVARLAATNGEVWLLTSRGARTTPEFATYLADTAVTVREVFATTHPTTGQVVAAVAEAVCSLDSATVLVMDADVHLKRWWYLAPKVLRGRGSRRPRVHFMLTRYPTRLSLGDRTSWERRLSKALLVMIAMATGTLHHVAGFAGRDDMSRGWLVRRARDPAECSAHSRDRAALRAQLELPHGVPIVGIFGVIDERRNAPLVLAAMRHEGLSHALLLLAGRLAPAMRTWLDVLPPRARDRILVIDEWLDNDRMDRLVAAVDVAPVPLALNGPSGIMGKALAAGVPVVTAGSKVRAREVRATGGGVAVDLTEDGLAYGLRRVLARGAGTSAGGCVPLATAEEFAAALLGTKSRTP